MGDFDASIAEIRELILEPDEENSKWGNPLLKSFYNEGYDDVCSKLGVVERMLVVHGGSVIDQTEYLMPNYVLGVKLAILDRVVSRPLPYDQVQLQISDQVIAAGSPSLNSNQIRRTYTRRQGDSVILGIFPAFPTAGKEIRVLGYSLAPHLVQGQDVPKLQAHLHRLPVFYAAWRALESEDIVRANGFQKKYADAIEGELQKALNYDGPAFVTDLGGDHI